METLLTSEEVTCYIKEKLHWWIFQIQIQVYIKNLCWVSTKSQEGQWRNGTYIYSFILHFDGKYCAFY